MCVLDPNQGNASRANIFLNLKGFIEVVHQMVHVDFLNLGMIQLKKQPN